MAHGKQRDKAPPKQYQELYNATPDIYLTVAHDGKILSVNRFGLACLGYSRKDLIGRCVWGIVHPDDRARVCHHFEECLKQSAKESELEFRKVRKDGSVLWVHEKSHRVSTRGKPTEFRVLCRDITAHKQAEEQLKQYSDQLEELVRERTEALEKEKERALVTLMSIGDAVIATNIKGEIDFLNPVAERLTGWRQAEAQGLPLRRVFNIIDEMTREPCEDPVEQCVRQATSTTLPKNAVLVHRDGREFSVCDSAAPIRDGKGTILGAVLVFRDVTEERDMARRLSYNATHDTLTGLVNRYEFEQRVDRVLATTDATKQHALLYLDLDQFKIVNDTCGHVAGDELLRQVAMLLKSTVRSRDTLARLGGDEFGVLLEHCPFDQTQRIANELRHTIRDFRFAWEDKGFRLGVSIGLVPITATSGSVAAVLSAADSACYAAKDKGRDRVHVHNEGDVELARRHGEMQWVAKIHHALEQDRFRLCFQPIRPIHPLGEEGEHYEVLLRMVDRVGHMLPPGAFLAAAERYNLATKLDRWVVEAVCRWLNRHPELCTHLSLCSINLSGQSLGDEEFLEFLTEMRAETHVSPEKICFEVTETAAIANLASATRFMGTLKDMGYRFALDDFGSGLSSFAYLKNLPVDLIKIDGVFVKDIVEDAIDFAMVKSINEVVHAMAKKTIAEFVETQAVLDQLRAIGVDYAQGYYIGQPQPLEEMKVSGLG